MTKNKITMVPQNFDEMKQVLELVKHENKDLNNQIQNLKTVLENLDKWVTIDKVCKHNLIDRSIISDQLMKEISKSLGYVIKINNSNKRYGQESYHIDCFRACYPTLNYSFKTSNINL